MIFARWKVSGNKLSALDLPDLTFTSYTTNDALLSVTQDISAIIQDEFHHTKVTLMMFEKVVNYSCFSSK